jgi:uncharacterized protein YceK
VDHFDELPFAKLGMDPAKMTRTVGLALALICLSACGTVADVVANHDVAYDSPGPHVYGGVRLDAVMGTKPFGSRGEAPLGILHWLDIPFALAFDTVLLPVTAVWSFFPEGRDYITVDRAGLDKTLSEEQERSSMALLLYVGSEDGYHHLRTKPNRAYTRYRILESDLSIERRFPYTTDSTQFVVLKGYHDPWPLPEPLKARQH